jgi:hypothetical protein
MPCYGGDDGPGTRTVYRDRDNPMLSAALCGILSHLESNKLYGKIIANLDYKEMGITREELQTWWAKHKREDKERREREKRQKEEVRKRRYNEYLKLKKEFE